MNDILIRGARSADLPRLLEIYGWYVENTAVSFEYETPSLAEFSARWARITARYPYLVAERDGRVLGYAYAGPFVGRAAYDWSCELTVYLDPESRGVGLGRRLYAALEDALRAMGVTNLYACIGWSETEDEYLTHASPAFHSALGFRLAGSFRQCGCKFGRWYDMIWMEKLIAPHLTPPSPVRSRADIPGEEK